MYNYFIQIKCSPLTTARYCLYVNFAPKNLCFWQNWHLSCLLFEVSRSQFITVCCVTACPGHLRPWCVYTKSLQSCLGLCDPKLQPSRSPCPWGSPGKKYLSGLPCPPPGNLPDPGIEASPLMSPALAGGGSLAPSDSLLSEPCLEGQAVSSGHLYSCYLLISFPSQTWTSFLSFSLPTHFIFPSLPLVSRKPSRCLDFWKNKAGKTCSTTSFSCNSGKNKFFPNQCFTFLRNNLEY